MIYVRRAKINYSNGDFFACLRITRAGQFSFYAVCLRFWTFRSIIYETKAFCIKTQSSKKRLESAISKDRLTVSPTRWKISLHSRPIMSHFDFNLQPRRQTKDSKTPKKNFFQSLTFPFESLFTQKKETFLDVIRLKHIISLNNFIAMRRRSLSSYVTVKGDRLL